MKPFVVVIFGASGSGKSSCLDLLAQAGGQYSISIKGTDRPRREYDGVEIQSVAEVRPNDYDYIYQTYGHRYGIQRSQIDQALAAGRHHFVICNDIDVIRAVRRDYGRAVRVLFHTFDAPREALLHIQEARGIDHDEIELRLAKTAALYRTFAENQDLFDAVLPNHYGEPLPQLKAKLERILLDFAVNEEQGIAAIETFRRFSERFAAELETTAREQVRAFEPGYVFILMGMRDEDPDSEDVHQTIKRTASELGMRAERVDEIQFSGQITEKIQASIRLAEIVVADLTHERPNVYYEVGYADAHNKPLVLLARKGSEVHFDLRGNKVLFYRNMTDLERALSKTLAALRATRRETVLHNPPMQPTGSASG